MSLTAKLTPAKDRSSKVGYYTFRVLRLASVLTTMVINYKFVIKNKFN